MSLSWKELARMTHLQGLEAEEVAVAGAECSLFPLHAPLLLNRYWELGMVIGVAKSETKVRGNAQWYKGVGHSPRLWLIGARKTSSKHMHNKNKLGSADISGSRVYNGGLQPETLADGS
eukprot:256948-Pelagomonas_calceolata.AAC.1